jgi:hypothetical protein
MSKFITHPGVQEIRGILVLIGFSNRIYHELTISNFAAIISDCFNITGNDKGISSGRPRLVQNEII